MFDALLPLYWTHYSVEIEAQTPLHLPEYKGSAFSRDLDIALQHVIGEKRTSSVYERLFETQVDAYTSRALEIGKNAPRPFVLEPPLSRKREFVKGERLTCHFSLIGDAIDTLPYLIAAFEVLGQRLGIGQGRRLGNGRFCILSVCNHRGDIFSTTTPVASSAREGILYAKEFLENSVATNNLSFHFLTPTRMRTRFKQHKRGFFIPKGGDDFFHLVHVLYRRIFTLTQIYCCEIVSNFKAPSFDTSTPTVKASTLRWHDWSRYSSRQQRMLQMGGFIGEITFTGEVEKYVPLFRIGQHLHIGSGTSLGLGNYTLL